MKMMQPHKQSGSRSIASFVACASTALGFFACATAVSAADTPSDSKPVIIWNIGNKRVMAPELRTLLTQRAIRAKFFNIPASEFEAKFAEAKQKNAPPDVLLTDNYNPIEPIESDLIAAPGVLNIANSFSFLVPKAPNFASARKLAMINRGLPKEHGWTLDTSSIEKAKKLNTPRNVAELDAMNAKAVGAYIAGNAEELRALAHSDMLDPAHKEISNNPLPRARTKNLTSLDLRKVYTAGNDRLAFCLVMAAYSSDKTVGTQPVFSIWKKDGKNNRWGLLTMSDDPVTITEATKFFPAIAGSLKNDGAKPGAATVAAVEPARLIAPENGKNPPRRPPFADFTYKPSTSQGKVAEIVEFDYGHASRLFAKPNPSAAISSGKLWTTRGKWSWRVWSIAANGDVAFSEARTFSH